jgi:ABC-type Co2+ transport system permease subunit
MITSTDLAGARVQALSATVGLVTFVFVGVAACLALVVGACYLAVSFVLLILQALVEVFGSLAATWAGADPLLKVIILAAVAYGGYRLYRSWRAKRGGACQTN